MTTRKRTVVASSLLVLLVGGIGVACGSDPAEMPALPDGSAPTSTTPPPPPVEAGADAADAGELVGLPPPPPTKQNEVTDAFGIFVSKGAAAGGDGTLAKPFTTISEGLEKAAAVKKRLYVCAGTYPEAIELKDGVSVVANLECTNPAEWKLSPSHATVTPLTSPAVTATNILTATRIDGLEVIAPAGSAAEPSSIALLADNSPGLTFSNGKLEAGAGKDGDNGVAPPQLTPRITAPEPGSPISNCAKAMFSCPASPPEAPASVAQSFPATPEARGGIIVCERADGAQVSSGRGGVGGTGRSFHAGNGFRSEATPGKSGTPASNPSRATSGSSSSGGTFTVTGFVPGNGTKGGDSTENGASGRGGDGGNITPLPAVTDRTRFVESGGGGGAGGCPGVAGTPGLGGGASVAALLIRSQVRFEDMSLSAANGGRGGTGTFGAEPTAGQAGAPGLQSERGLNGYSGPTAGVSGHGAGGPSIAIVYTGLAPLKAGTTKLVHGVAGTSPSVETRPSFELNIARTIPAAGAAKAQDELAFTP